MVKSQQEGSVKNKAVHVIRNNEDAGKITSFLSLWISAPEHTRTGDEQKVINEMQDAAHGMIENIYAILTPQQKQRLRSTIQDYITDLEALAGQPQVTAARTVPSLAFIPY